MRMRAYPDLDDKNTNVLISKIRSYIDKMKTNKEKELKYIIDGFKYNKIVINNVRTYFQTTEGYIVTVNNLTPFTLELSIRWR